MTITQIKQLMRRHDCKPLKWLGQNFLIDRNIVDKIVASAGFGADDTVLEIGAGMGNMTVDIAHRVRRVIALEYDKKLCAILRETAQGHPSIEPVCQDIAKFDIGSCARGRAVRVIGNLPYYITSLILEYIVVHRAYIRDALIMVQKEVKDRLIARPGGKVYGALTCFVAYHARIECRGIIKRTSFFPQPEVDSALIYLRMLDAPSVGVDDEKLFFRIIRTAFNQRRKTIVSSLSRNRVLGIDRKKVERLLERSGVPPDARPESLGLEDFARISHEFPR